MTKMSRLVVFLAVIATTSCAGLVVRPFPPPDVSSPGYWLSGTYELEHTRGDDPRRAADAATRDLPRTQRDRAYQDLLARLEPPDMIAIERMGRRVTISSSDGPRTSFDVDGRMRQEAYSRRSMSTRAEFIGDRLRIVSQGYRAMAFVVTFDPYDRGDSLVVTRQLDNDDLRRPVEIRSYYRRISRDPRWDLYRGGVVMSRSYLVPMGTRMVATLDTAIVSRSMRGGERFSMTVQSPLEFRGARIDGVVGRVTTYALGQRAELRLYFDRITFKDRESDFEGEMSGVRLGGSARVHVDAVHDADAGQQAVEGGAIGAALGAIIGAIAGGGKGAAIGAMIGGVGGVIVAEDNSAYVDLPAGTEISLVATGIRR